ncbi:hypothetical protein AK830_g6938 [Neonectria ditissima]|uniref:Sphingoid long-chain base transporter RSB1 n=1 Tax=Neonectria ditissima TaxID=78410 RepID=A0A0P7BB70_9HYPO|nr:hypothetical protein AK830_g6938 [Neonectria ditissima]
MSGSIVTLPNGLVTFGPNANCTLDTCPLEASLLRYQPNIPATAVPIAIFGLSLLLHTWQGARTKTWGFMGSMICGCILEIIGYAGRLIIHDNPFDFNGFLMQIICITVAPVFFCSAIYVLLSQVINFVDPSISRFRPQLFYWIFIPCDIVSLILQAVGGALSCVATNRKAIENGENISLAGLIFQVVTLVVFSALFADYVFKVARSPSRDRLTKIMVTFLGLLFTSTFIVLVRCAYRIVELGQGYFSAIFRDEGLFIGLETVTMCVAALLLNVGHPGRVFSRKEVTDNTKDMDPPFEYLASGTNEGISMASIAENQENK